MNWWDQFLHLCLLSHWQAMWLVSSIGVHHFMTWRLVSVSFSNMMISRNSMVSPCAHALSLKVNGLLKKLVQTICKRVLKCGVKSRSNRLCRASYLNLQILRFLYNCLMWYRKSFTNTLPGVFRSTLCRSFHFPPTFEGLWPRKEISPWINNDCLVWTILWMDPQMWCQTQVIEQVVQGFPFLNLNILKFLFLWCDTIASPFAKFFARSIQVNSMHELPFFSYIWGFAVLKKSYSFKNCIIVLWTICGRILKYGV